MIHVSIRTPVNRDVYINGAYDEVADTIPCIKHLVDGSHKFETVSDGCVDHRGEVVNRSNGARIVLDLKPVIPPEPIR
jgi:hypothetical protein